jgi:hypothetical protein
VYFWQIGNEGKQCLQYFQLYINAQVHSVAHREDKLRDGGLRNRFKSNEAL